MSKHNQGYYSAFSIVYFCLTYSLTIMESINKEILITGNSLLSDIQKEFNSNYRFLKIEFFIKERNLFFFRSHRVYPDCVLKQIRTKSLYTKVVELQIKAQHDQ